MNVSGVVERITDRKFGNSTLYSVKVGGNFYGMGKTKPNFREGDSISFSSDLNARGYQEVKGEIKLEQRTATTTTTTGTGARAGYLPDREKQAVIARQAARNSAIALLQVGASFGILPLPKAEKDKFDALLTLCDQLTDDFVDYAMNGRVSEESASTDSPEVAESWDGE